MSKKGETLLLFGGIPEGYLREWEITRDLELVEEKLHVDFVSVPHDGLLSAYRSVNGALADEARELALGLIEGSSKGRKKGVPDSFLVLWGM